MSVHNQAKKGEIAESVLLPGDPMRAKFIAENYLTDLHCYNQVRGMFGYTGLYQGVRVSVQGTGMGVPSISIYVSELIQEYGVQNLIRIGTCGALREEVQVRELILAMSSSTDSAVNKHRFHGMDYAPCANYELLNKAHQIAQEQGFKIKVGNILTSDTFYHDEHLSDRWKLWAKYGVLAVEMETTALYTLAAQHNVKALSVLSVSDSLVTGASTSPQERETTLHDLITVGLKLGTS